MPTSNAVDEVDDDVVERLRVFPQERVAARRVAHSAPGMPACSAFDSGSGIRMSSAPASTIVGTAILCSRAVVSCTWMACSCAR